MITALALVPALLTFVQDAKAAPPKVWTQAELEAVSAEIKSDIETMRGTKFQRPVKVKVTDKKGFIEYARKRQEKTETPERKARDEWNAKLLGLVPIDMNLQAALEKLLEGQVGGFYDPGSDTFYLMDSFGGDLARIILAHELTHALDDQCFDLDGQLAKLHQESDAEFAFQAVVEGSGTSAMNQWTMQHLKDLDRAALLESSDLETQGLAEAPQFLWKPLIAAYLRGEGFLVHTAGMNVGMKASKTEDIRRAFEHPPRSSEQILHPDKYWDADKVDEPRKVSVDASKLQSGWKVAGEDTLGEITLALVTTPLDQRKPFDPKNPLSILGIQYTNKAAEGWGGDRAVLLEKGDARVLWLVTAWDRPEDAQEFQAAVAAVFPDDPKAAIQHRIERPGDADVVVVVASHGVAPGDVPTLTWKVEPKAKPDEKR